MAEKLWISVGHAAQHHSSSGRGTPAFLLLHGTNDEATMGESVAEQRRDIIGTTPVFSFIA